MSKVSQVSQANQAIFKKVFQRKWLYIKNFSDLPVPADSQPPRTTVFGFFNYLQFSPKNKD